MADCSYNCSSCGKTCKDREEGSKKKESNKHSNIKKVIGIVSGKGGVGKSSVTSLMAVAANNMGKKVAVMDADITGPSIPKAFGINKRAMGNEEILLPVESNGGIKTMSINLLLEHTTDPVVWRGPVVGNVVEQFWDNVVWGDIDVMFVDMPPGTGDVALTVYQSLPIDGIIIVTSPQELVNMIVEKAYKMADMMNIPILGMVENMASFKCPDCGKTHKIFGDSHLDEVAKLYGIEKVVSLPIDPDLAYSCDHGNIESYKSEEITNFANDILE